MTGIFFQQNSAKYMKNVIKVLLNIVKKNSAAPISYDNKIGTILGAHMACGTIYFGTEQQPTLSVLKHLRKLNINARSTISSFYIRMRYIMAVTSIGQFFIRFRPYGEYP